jgi:hypothetical protein
MFHYLPVPIILFETPDPGTAICIIYSRYIHRVYPWTKCVEIETAHDWLPRLSVHQNWGTKPVGENGVETAGDWAYKVIVMKLEWTNSMSEINLKAGSRTVRQDIFCFFYRKRYHVNEKQLLDHILSQINPMLILTPYFFVPFKPEIQLHNVLKLVFTSQETLCHHYKNHSVNDVKVNNPCLFWESYEA